jgi:hypothetical protein
MAMSFVPGDSANYLNLANTGGLNDRGNGLPLFITTLNAAVHLPLPMQVSDGVRCGFMMVLFGVATVMLTFRAGLTATGSAASAFAAGVAVLFSGLIWQSTAWIMPHIALAFVGAVVLNLMLTIGPTGPPRAASYLGLACGLGFGLMPNTMLLFPTVALYLWLHLGKAARVGALVRFGAATAFGIVVNIVLMAVHESIVPTVSGPKMSIAEATWFYLRGGDETSWFLHNVTLGHFIRGLLRLPLEIAAEFEFLGTALAMLGLAVGLRRRFSLHISLLVAFGLVALWVGIYPGDTNVLHGATAYPIAALWLAVGAAWVISRLESWPVFRRLELLHPRLSNVTLSAGLCAALVAGIVGGKLVYRDALCGQGSWLFQGFCRERVPEASGNLYFERARDAVMRVPEGALVLGAAWDATHQMNYFIRVHRTREGVDGAFDLTKLEVGDFVQLAQPYWQRGEAVYLFGDWKDVEMWSPEVLAYVDAMPQSDFLFELRSAERARN